MVRMRYFAVADRFILRMAEDKKIPEGPMRHAQGRCLVEMERFAEARQALSRAGQLGVRTARLTLVNALLDQGDLDGAARELAAVQLKSRAWWLARSRLHRLKDQPDQAVRAAQAAVLHKAAADSAPGGRSIDDARAHLALGRAWLKAGKADEARAAFRRAIRVDAEPGWEARFQLARAELALGQARAALKTAWPLTQRPERRFRVAGSALLANAAAQLGLGHLAALQTRRARYHAFTDPESLAVLADLLIERGRGLAVALDALRVAQGKRPRWSQLYAHLAFVYGQIRQLPRAMQAITAALSIRPDYPPYRAIERALVKLGGRL
jgi:tetratricopeptide (TPR) repeat protein